MTRSFAQITGMFHRCPQLVLNETAEQAKLSQVGVKDLRLHTAQIGQIWNQRKPLAPNVE